MPTEEDTDSWLSTYWYLLVIAGCVCCCLVCVLVWATQRRTESTRFEEQTHVGTMDLDLLGGASPGEWGKEENLEQELEESPML